MTQRFCRYRFGQPCPCRSHPCDLTHDFCWWGTELTEWKTEEREHQYLNKQRPTDQSIKFQSRCNCSGALPAVYRPLQCILGSRSQVDTTTAWCGHSVIPTTPQTNNFGCFSYLEGHLAAIRCRRQIPENLMIIESALDNHIPTPRRGFQSEAKNSQPVFKPTQSVWRDNSVHSPEPLAKRRALRIAQSRGIAADAAHYSLLPNRAIAVLFARVSFWN